MSKAVLISIQPKWCELIANGKKTVEVRKTKPKLSTPFKVYIYCTNDFSNHATKSRRNKFWVGEPINNMSKGRYLGNGKVIGEFVCDTIISHCEMANADIAEQQGYIKREKLLKYAGDKEIYGWHISDLVIYDKPKDLSEFRKPLECHRGKVRDNCIGCWDCDITRPPQSWCYVEELRI